MTWDGIERRAPQQERRRRLFALRRFLIAPLVMFTEGLVIGALVAWLLWGLYRYAA